VAELDWTVTLGHKFYRPWVLILTPGNTAVCTVEPARVSLLDGMNSSVTRLIRHQAGDPRPLKSQEAYSS
jgi:hypothetical protein